MPELPEVETVRLALAEIVNESKVSNVKIYRKDLRWDIIENFENDLVQDTLKKPYRKGKYILIPTFKENVLLIHLGMSGHIKITANKKKLSKHDHVLITLITKEKNTYTITYNDPRRFGFIDLFYKEKINDHFLLKNLGVEPLSKEYNVEYLKKIFHTKSKCVKNAIIDQSIIAGIGNIYASEILYIAGIHPLRSVNTLSEKNINSIIKATKLVLKKAIIAGGTSIKNHFQPDGKLGYFTQKLKVYGKKNQNCNKCKKLINLVIVSKRSTYFCSWCQN